MLTKHAKSIVECNQNDVSVDQQLGTGHEFRSNFEFASMQVDQDGVLLTSGHQLLWSGRRKKVFTYFLNVWWFSCPFDLPSSKNRDSNFLNAIRRQNIERRQVTNFFLSWFFQRWKKEPKNGNSAKSDSYKRKLLKLIVLEKQRKKNKFVGWSLSEKANRFSKKRGRRCLRSNGRQNKLCCVWSGVAHKQSFGCCSGRGRMFVQQTRAKVMSSNETKVKQTAQECCEK